MRLDQLAAAVGDLGVLAGLVERPSGDQISQPRGSYAFPGVPPIAMIVVSGSSANAVRLTPGARRRTCRRARRPVAVELEPRAALLDDVELLVARRPRRAR